MVNCGLDMGGFPYGWFLVTDQLRGWIGASAWRSEGRRGDPCDDEWRDEWHDLSPVDVAMGQAVNHQVYGF